LAKVVKIKIRKNEIEAKLGVLFNLISQIANPIKARIEMRL
jgi:hypothetical protein